MSDAGSWRLVFSVRDTGIGIAKEKHELVFQSFSQADASTARAYGGTGLGLAISRRLVELMGGRIWLESREGAGSTFSFEVELAASTTPQVPLCRPPCALVGLRALVIDDNQTTRTMLQRELAARGVEVEETSEGGAGVRKAVEMQERGRPFDAILIDLHLPDLDGFQVAQRLRESYGLEQAALLMITSERIAETAQRADEMGLAYVVKPVRVEALLQALTQLRGGGMAEPEEVAPAAETFPIPPCTEILVAEDNPVNLTVTEAILRNAGALVSAATNGKEAVNAVTSRNFSAVLMDVQMPEIDGCTATHILRERGVSVPIIGLTAHALEGDRERCLAAGMNDYMSKPVSAEALVEKVGHWARLHPLPPAEPGQLLAQLGGDRGIFDGVVQSFMENVPEQLLDVLTAAQNEDAERLEKAAHRVKGALSVVRAERARCLAQAVEYAARSEDLGRARDLLPHLEGEVTRVIQQLQRPVPPLA